MTILHPISEAKQRQIERVVEHLELVETRLQSDLDRRNMAIWSIDYTDLLFYVSWLQMLLGERTQQYHANVVEWCCGSPKRYWD